MASFVLRMRAMRYILFTLLLSTSVLACSKKSDGEAAPPSGPATTTPAGGGATPTTPPAGSGSARLEARKKFNEVCAQCHGASGKGDGPAAAALNPKPRDYTDGAWQKTVTDAQLSEAILKGGAAIGKSASMPPNPDLEAKPEVVAELVKIVRAFAPAQ